MSASLKVHSWGALTSQCCTEYCPNSLGRTLELCTSTTHHFWPILSHCNILECFTFYFLCLFFIMTALYWQVTTTYWPHVAAPRQLSPIDFLFPARGGVHTSSLLQHFIWRVGIIIWLITIYCGLIKHYIYSTVPYVLLKCVLSSLLHDIDNVYSL